jgi:hypothetical protein
MLAGALMVPLLAVAGAAALGQPPAQGATFLHTLVFRALGPSGWIGLPVLGAGLGALTSLAWARSGAGTIGVLALGLGLGLLGAALVVRMPTAFPGSGGGGTRSLRGKAQAIRRAAFRSPAAIADILPYAGDGDPVVREQTMLALGVNLVVAGIEHATPERPAPDRFLPVRDSIRVRLMGGLEDPVEAVRAEAARALWKAPRAFGRVPAAADTLAAILDRALRPDAVERLAWLALDAAAGAPDPGLKAAAARFGAVTADSDLARAARLAARP